jgi:hypothetical protein
MLRPYPARRYKNIAISNLLKTSSSLPSQGIGSSTLQMSYFEELQERKRSHLSDEQDQYFDCSFCIATSNTVEPLFSTFKHVLTDQSKCMCLRPYFS